MSRVHHPAQHRIAVGRSPGTVVHRMASPALVAVGGLGAMLLLHNVDPRQPGHYPTCPFLAITGLYCPGCGGLRAIASITDGDLGAAVAYNPLAVAALALGCWMLGASFVRQWRGLPGSVARVEHSWFFRFLPGLILVFWIMRNLPGMTWLSPG